METKEYCIIVLKQDLAIDTMVQQLYNKSTLDIFTLLTVTLLTVI